VRGLDGLDTVSSDRRLDVSFEALLDEPRGTLDAIGRFLLQLVGGWLDPLTKLCGGVACDPPRGGLGGLLDDGIVGHGRVLSLAMVVAGLQIRDLCRRRDRRHHRERP
jgi:hypothetical protein